MVEHTLHILILPGLHSATSSPSSPLPAADSDSTVSLLSDTAHSRALHFQHSSLSFWPPSPFHLKLPIITRLSFNDAGKITHHRDFWDVKVPSAMRSNYARVR